MKQSPSIFSPLLIAALIVGAGACVVVDDSKATTPARAGTVTQAQGAPAGDEPANSYPVSDEPANTEPANTEPANTEPVAAEPNSEPAADAEPSDSLTVPDASKDILARIRDKYLTGIKRCHYSALKVDPNANGSVIIRLTVGPKGSISRADVKGFNPTIDACIKDQAVKWRFNAPKDEDGKPTSHDLEIPLLLKPNH